MSKEQNSAKRLKTTKTTIHAVKRLSEGERGIEKTKKLTKR